jgi:hypothetical protein
MGPGGGEGGGVTTELVLINCRLVKLQVSADCKLVQHAYIWKDKSSAIAKRVEDLGEQFSLAM